MIGAIMAIVLGWAAPAFAQGEAASCHSRLEQAKDELIRRGFAPTTDKDTARWLHVSDGEGGALELALQMRTSADGAATGYWLQVAPARKPGSKGTTRWRTRRHPYCCDEHAAREDGLIETTWKRQAGGVAAEVSIIEFGAFAGKAEEKARREMFAEVARGAADDCLRRGR